MINVDHRNSIGHHSKEEYEGYSKLLVSSLSKIDFISSIVVCGSLAKNDIVPGWSDIDLILFLESSHRSIDQLDVIKAKIKSASKEYRIGIGLDITYIDEFLTTNKICGRPLMMTYEVKHYGKIEFGLNYFEKIEEIKLVSNSIEIERKPLILAELHSWRRIYTFSKESIPPNKWLFECSKSLLRIMQIETGPNLIRPLNSESVLRKLLKKDFLSKDQKIAFSTAVEIRKNWIDYKNRSFIDSEINLISECLNNYIHERYN
ncbi:MAG: nucleotidyltransferase domain-containing protein [Reichenbachiella sp.]|uniref:nucleotidyltransferase domain-containing protein n=1 Tax=Reichenbachiella sp. TaxID=2184521 RepID=UPI0032655624